MTMYPKNERLAAVAEISRVERIQHGLMDNDPKAVDEAMEMIQQIAELENGFMFLMTGIHCMLTYIERDGNTTKGESDE